MHTSCVCVYGAFLRTVTSLHGHIKFVWRRHGRRERHGAVPPQHHHHPLPATSTKPPPPQRARAKRALARRRTGARKAWRPSRCTPPPCRAFQVTSLSGHVPFRSRPYQVTSLSGHVPVRSRPSQVTSLAGLVPLASQVPSATPSTPRSAQRSASDTSLHIHI